MAVRTYIDETMDMAVQEIRGDLTADEVLKAQHELYVELGFDPAKPCLWDATEGNVAGAMTGGDMQGAARRSSALWERMAGGRTAILVARESDFGMGRMYEQLAAGMPRELGVFRDREEALVWLRGPGGTKVSALPKEGTQDDE